MLSCFYEGKFFNNDQEGFTEIDKRLLGKERKLICPICSQPVYYNSKGKVVSHFSHYPGTACNEKLLRSYDVDNNVHDNTKEMFSNWLKSQFPGAVVVKDRYFPDMKLISDVYFELDDLRIAFEIQLKHITPEKLVERRELYKNNDIKDIWIFGREGSINPGSPYERHYYQRNSRELYYIDIKTGMFTYFKGLKREHFDIPCVNLQHYVSRSCKLYNVAFKKDGFLDLPGCREAYINKLHELRYRKHDEIRKRAEFKEGAVKRLQKRLNYEGNKYMKTQASEPAKDISKKHKENSALKLASKVQPKNKKNEYIYDTISLSETDARKYLNIKFQGEADQTIYEVISSNDAGAFKLYICRGLVSDHRTLSGKGYIVKVFCDSNRLTVEDWF